VYFNNPLISVESRAIKSNILVLPEAYPPQLKICKMVSQSEQRKIQSPGNVQVMLRRNPALPTMNPSIKIVPVGFRCDCRPIKDEVDSKIDDGSQVPNLRCQWTGSLGHSWEGMCLLWYTLLNQRYERKISSHRL
jgi:hypothetical protein